MRTKPDKFCAWLDMPSNRDPRKYKAEGARGEVFWHPCSVQGCREWHAPFGIPITNERGETARLWFCSQHKPKG